MTTVPRHGEIEVEQDLEFQGRDWRAQRIGRIAMALVLVAALLGTFGDGPLSHASARTPDGRLRVDYDRIVRHDAPQPLRIQLGALQAADSVVELWIDQNYMQGVVINEISPEPSASLVGDGKLIYRFRVARLPSPALILFELDADELWSRRGAVGLVHGDSVRIRQFVLP